MRALEGRGFHVEEAKDGQEALARLLSSVLPDAIVLRLALPKLSGAELLDVMSRYVRLARIPAILLTGEDQPIAPRYGALVASFSAPYDVDDLVRALETALASARSRA